MSKSVTNYWTYGSNDPKESAKIAHLFKSHGFDNPTGIAFNNENAIYFTSSACPGCICICTDVCVHYYIKTHPNTEHLLQSTKADILYPTIDPIFREGDLIKKIGGDVCVEVSRVNFEKQTYTLHRNDRIMDWTIGFNEQLNWQLACPPIFRVGDLISNKNTHQIKQIKRIEPRRYVMNDGCYLPISAQDHWTIVVPRFRVGDSVSICSSASPSQTIVNISPSEKHGGLDYVFEDLTTVPVTDNDSLKLNFRPNPSFKPGQMIRHKRTGNVIRIDSIVDLKTYKYAVFWESGVGFYENPIDGIDMENVLLERQPMYRKGMVVKVNGLFGIIQDVRAKMVADEVCYSYLVGNQYAEEGQLSRTDFRETSKLNQAPTE